MLCATNGWELVSVRSDCQTGGWRRAGGIVGLFVWNSLAWNQRQCVAISEVYFPEGRTAMPNRTQGRMEVWWVEGQQPGHPEQYGKVQSILECLDRCFGMLIVFRIPSLSPPTLPPNIPSRCQGQSLPNICRHRIVPYDRSIPILCMQ